MEKECKECTVLGTVDNPEDCKKGLNIVKELGHGDIGVAFEIMPGAQNRAINDALDPNGKYVLKRVELNRNEKSYIKNLEDFKIEACIGKILGDLDIAPKIYSCWTCDSIINSKVTKYGYYVMDRFDGDWKYKYGLGKGSKQHQLELIRCLAIMVKNGYLHNDCHLGNIGFKGDNVILFDFGFTLPVPTDCERCMMSLPFLLAGQLSIVTEQMSIENKVGTVKNRNFMSDIINYIYTHPNVPIDFYVDIRNIERIISNKELTKNAINPKPQSPITYEEQSAEILNIIGSLACRGTNCENYELMGKLYKIIEPYSNVSYTHTDGKGYNDYIGYDADGEKHINLLLDLIYLIRQNKLQINNISQWLTENKVNFTNIPPGGQVPPATVVSEGRTLRARVKKGGSRKKVRRHSRKHRKKTRHYKHLK
jgi:hypothetical protein